MDIKTYTITTEKLTISSAQISPINYVKLYPVLIKSGIIATIEDFSSFLVRVAALSDSEFESFYQIAFSQTVVNGQKLRLDAFQEDMIELYQFLHEYLKVNFSRLAQRLGIPKASSKS